jgi:GNAT superfamily N-acetyltransferase
VTAPAGVVYRTATVHDVPALSSLRVLLTFEDEGPPATVPPGFDASFAAVVREGIESGRWVVWLAEADGLIVAHAFVGLIEKIPRPVPTPRFVGYLTNVYTRPELRSRGIGADLLTRVTEWAGDHDVELLLVWPSESSIPLYERAGFASRRDPLVWLA